MKGVSLIGMPGSGKSTIGAKLAEKLDYNFVDLDRMIEQTHMPIQQLLHCHGALVFKLAQDRCIQKVSLDGTVLAPGGCIVYSQEAMHRLTVKTRIVYLDVARDILRMRLQDTLQDRGIVDLQKRGGFDGVFDHRKPLYEKYAHITIPVTTEDEDAVLEKVLNVLA